MSDLSHVDEAGDVRMVDVGGKPLSRRRAVAAATVRMAPETARAPARAAQGRRARDRPARRRHGGEADARADPALPPAAAVARRRRRSRSATARVEITASAETTAQTGVEMEALTAASVAALTVYDMAKAIDKEMVVDGVRLVEKTKEPVVRAAVLTVSDGVSEGTREDRSGDLLAELLAAEGFEVERRVVPDERDAIAAAIVELADDAQRRAHHRRHRPRPARRHARGDDARCSTARRPGSPRRSAPTRSRRRRTRCSRAGSPASAARRSSSTCPARPAAAATASRCSSRRSRTRSQLLAGETQSGHRQT